MRLAGTINGKTGAYARIVEADLALPAYPIGQLVGDLPDPAPPSRRAPAATGTSRDPYKRISPPRVLREARRDRRPARRARVAARHPARGPQPVVLGRDQPRAGVALPRRRVAGRGGAIYDLASVLLGGPWGHELRGEAFNRARAYVADVFGEPHRPRQTTTSEGVRTHEQTSQAHRDAARSPGRSDRGADRRGRRDRRHGTPGAAERPRADLREREALPRRCTRRPRGSRCATPSSRRSPRRHAAGTGTGCGSRRTHDDARRSENRRHRALRPHGPRFYAIVVERRERELEVDPIDRRVTYRRVKAREVIGIWRKSRARTAGWSRPWRSHDRGRTERRATASRSSCGSRTINPASPGGRRQSPPITGSAGSGVAAARPRRSPDGDASRADRRGTAHGHSAAREAARNLTRQRPC